MLEDYTPGPDDLVWGIRMLTLINDGGVLAFPATKLLYLVSHTDKTLTLLDPEILEDEFSAIVHRRTINTFHELGYMVLVKEEGI